MEYEGQSTHIGYPLNPQTGERYTGRSFHHGRFIKKLRESCENTKAVTIFEATANELVRDDGITVTGVRCTPKYKPTGGNTSSTSSIVVRGKLVIIADGCMSKFRKQVTSSHGNDGVKGRNPVTKSHLTGFLANQCCLPRPNNGHIFLGKPSSIIMYQISATETRVLVDVPGNLPSASSGALAKYMRNVAVKDIPSPVRDSFLKALDTERLRSMPAQYLPPSDNTEPGVLLVGDAFNMRHPLTGGGMTVALWDVVHIRDILYELVYEELEYSGRLQYIGGEQLRQTLVNELRGRRWSRAACINILAQSLHAIISGNASGNGCDETGMLREGCFRFFELGPDWTSGLAGTIAGIKTEPIAIFVYLFAIACYSMYISVASSKTALHGIGAVVNGCKVIYAVLIALLPTLFAELFS
ncbi:SE-domain-containing protein [Ramicandelaber brevisporus]|nr:SE-domain-containing protein [Ramicandelaber brevisporus]